MIPHDPARANRVGRPKEVVEHGAGEEHGMAALAVVDGKHDRRAALLEAAQDELHDGGPDVRVVDGTKEEPFRIGGERADAGADGGQHPLPVTLVEDESGAPAGVRSVRKARHARLDALGVVSHDDEDGLASRRGEHGNEVLEKRLAGIARKREERFRRAHTPGLSGREDEGGDRHRRELTRGSGAAPPSCHNDRVDRASRSRWESALLLSEVLKRALPREARRRIYSIELVQSRWKEAVGYELARRSEPEALGHGVLTVRVTDPAWGRMIAKLQHRIAASLNRAVGMNLVQRVQFVRRERLRKLGVDAPLARARVSKSDTPPPPPAGVETALDAVADAELREILRRSASRYFQAQRERAARGR